jgi:hypothetical protein
MILLVLQLLKHANLNLILQATLILISFGHLVFRERGSQMRVTTLAYVIMNLFFFDTNSTPVFIIYILE